MKNCVFSEILDEIKNNSDQCIDKMRRAAETVFAGRNDLVIGVNGSVARREFTTGSDVDLFFIGLDEHARTAEAQTQYRDLLRGEGLKMPANGGVFEAPQTREELLDPIGGDEDGNKSITRRMLFLLEGEWIFNQQEFERLRVTLIEKYVRKDLESDKLCLYLLNDIIRYWRTICIDFEHKTSDGEKPRAIRLIKLRMSRMLLYFAGVAAVAHAIDMPPADKRNELVRLFSLPAIVRLEEIYGDSFAAATEHYGKFLSRLNEPTVRAALEKRSPDGLKTPEFIEMSDLARHFKDELLGLIAKRHGLDSPIVHALLL